MQYVAAYALLTLGGKANPSKWHSISLGEADIKGLLSEVGATTDDGQVK